MGGVRVRAQLVVALYLCIARVPAAALVRPLEAAFRSTGQQVPGCSLCSAAALLA